MDAQNTENKSIIEKNKHTDKQPQKPSRSFSGYWRMLTFPLMLMYLELLFHIAVYKRVDGMILYPILSGAVFGMVLALFTVLFRNIGNIIIGYIGLAVFCVYDIVQLIYYRIFGTFLSLVSVGGAENAMNFKVVLFEKLRENIPWILAFLLPVAVLVFLHVKVVSFQRPTVKQNMISVAGTIILAVLSVLLLNVHGRGVYSPYQLFHNQYVLELSMKRLGVSVTTIRDAQTMLSGGKKDVKFTLETDDAEEQTDSSLQTQTDPATETDADMSQEQAGKQYKPQVDDSIDFVALYHGTEDESLKNLSAYCAKREPTMENEYTGMFSGYNVVFITAESLCGYGISEKCTPTLYKLMNEGFVFENYYNPIWYHSTIDGEYTNCLGQYPCASEWSFYKSAETSQPYALGNALNARGYTSKAYHDFDFYYYNRSETHANMGYDFKAVDYGLDIPFFGSYSDIDMMEAAYPEFINEDKFHVYFMTFSGHLPYDYKNNAIAVRNQEEAERLTEGMNLPEEAVAYIATQIELDKALELLIEKLEQAGKLEQTVFIITPDHYPYGLSADAYDALAGKAVADDDFEKHRSCLGIWSSSMEKQVKIDKLCASVDVLPTVLNLLGIDYDSRLLAGNDILSESEELVIFADHSFITDKIKYDTETGKVTYLVDEKRVSGDYLEEKIEEVENILYISDEIINTDFFSYVFGK